MDITIQLKGFAELAAALREMPDNVNRNALRAAVNSGAAIVRDEAKLRAPVETGTLRRAMYVKQIRELSGTTRQTFYIGARQGKKERAVGKKKVNRDAYYARWVEGGHKIVPRGSKATTALNRLGRRITGLTIRRNAAQGFVPPHEFLQPAFKAKIGAATDAMATKLRERIERYRNLGK